MAKTYSGFYITNANYGGYSTREKTDRGTVISGMVDYVGPSTVLRLAGRHRKRVSLAGGAWSRVGYKGWGEKITVREAKKALAKLRGK